MSDEGFVARGDFVGVADRTGGIWPAQRDLSSGNSTSSFGLSRVIASTVRSTASARLAFIVSIGRHGSGARSRCCQRVPSAFRRIPTVAGSASAARKTSPRSRRSFSDCRSCVPSLVTKPMSAESCFIYGAGTCCWQYSGLAEDAWHSIRPIYCLYIGEQPAIFIFLRKNLAGKNHGKAEATACIGNDFGFSRKTSLDAHKIQAGSLYHLPAAWRC